jgi:uncharacterized membrane protein YphA (DoxX/SURF4 family)
MSLTQSIGKCTCRLHGLMEKTRSLDFTAALLLRLYLAPIFLMAAINKFNTSDGKFLGIPVPETVWGIFPVVNPNVINWFGNSDWGLGMPAPALMAYLASYTELLGAMLLLFGLAVRWISIPLMATMVVAAVSVHWKNGWLAIADGKMFLFADERVMTALDRKSKAISLLKEHGNYSWLTNNGDYAFVVLNNGIEFAATYFIMLLALFFIGGGKYVSADYWIKRRFHCEVSKLSEAS